MKTELPRPSELLQTDAALRWYADNLRMVKGEPYVNDRGVLLPFGVAAERIVEIIKDIIPRISRGGAPPRWIQPSSARRPTPRGASSA